MLRNLLSGIPRIPIWRSGPGPSGPNFSHLLDRLAKFSFRRGDAAQIKKPLLPVRDLSVAASGAAAPPGTHVAKPRIEPKTLLPSKFYGQVSVYKSASDVAHRPAGISLRSLELDSLEDAFARKVTTASGLGESLVPASLRESPPMFKPPTTASGGRAEEHPHALCDRRTGMAASVLANDREVILSFGGTGSQGMTRKHLSADCMALFSTTPSVPANFRQAAEWTQLMKAHIDGLNARLPPGEKPYKLTLGGHSMGGGMATYAAAMHGVEAWVTSPMPLGPGVRKVLEKNDALDRAHMHVTAIVPTGDVVSDRDSFKPMGQRFYLPKISVQNQAELGLTLGLPGLDAQGVLKRHNGIHLAISFMELMPEAAGVEPQRPTRRS